MNKLKQSLLIMDYFAWIVMRKSEIIYTKSLHSISEKQKVWDDENFHTLSHLSIINTCSFLEEYNDKFGVITEPEYKDKIIAVKRICSPFVKAIHKWSDFNSYRNLLAHTLRDKTGNFAHLNSDLNNSYNVPTNAYEWLFVRDCIIFIKQVLNKEFAIELYQASAEMSKMYYNPKRGSIIEIEHIEDKLLELVAESKYIANKYNRRYDYDIRNFYNENKPVMHTEHLGHLEVY